MLPFCVQGGGLSNSLWWCQLLWVSCKCLSIVLSCLVTKRSRKFMVLFSSCVGGECEVGMYPVHVGVYVGG